MRALLPRITVVAALLVLGAGTTRPATATDLEAVRSRAQAIADEVSELERRLQGLQRRHLRLEEEIAEAGRKLGLIELRLHDARRAYSAALDRYVVRAVEAYKGAASDRVALLLSARDIGDLMLVEYATSRSARADALALAELQSAQLSAAARQEEVDAVKQRLIAAEAEVARTAATMESTLELRRSMLRRLNAEVARLEEQARRAAARAAVPDQALRDLLEPAGPSQGIPDGFASTGVSFEGIASWYGPGFEGNPTASGQIFDPDLFTAASKELELGTWLYVEHEGRGVVVLVNDRGPYVEGRILDLSAAAARAVGITGLGWVRAEILVKTDEG